MPSLTPRGCQLAAVALCWPLLSLAQGRPEVSDPAAPVPAPIYHPAWTSAQPRGVAEGSADWLRANAEVGQFRRGHADLVRWEARQPAAPQGSSATPEPPHWHEHAPQGGQP